MRAQALSVYVGVSVPVRLTQLLHGSDPVLMDEFRDGFCVCVRASASMGANGATTAAPARDRPTLLAVVLSLSLCVCVCLWTVYRLA